MHRYIHALRIVRHHSLNWFTSNSTFCFQQSERTSFDGARSVIAPLSSHVCVRIYTFPRATNLGITEQRWIYRGIERYIHTDVRTRRIRRVGVIFVIEGLRLHARRKCIHECNKENAATHTGARGFSMCTIVQRASEILSKKKEGKKKTIMRMPRHCFHICRSVFTLFLNSLTQHSIHGGKRTRYSSLKFLVALCQRKSISAERKWLCYFSSRRARGERRKPLRIKHQRQS